MKIEKAMEIIALQSERILVLDNRLEELKESENHWFENYLKADKQVTELKKEIEELKKSSINFENVIVKEVV